MKVYLNENTWKDDSKVPLPSYIIEHSLFVFKQICFLPLDGLLLFLAVGLLPHLVQHVCDHGQVLKFKFRRDVITQTSLVDLMSNYVNIKIKVV